MPPFYRFMLNMSHIENDDMALGGLLPVITNITSFLLILATVYLLHLFFWRRISNTFFRENILGTYQVSPTAAGVSDLSPNRLGATDTTPPPPSYINRTVRSLMEMPPRGPARQWHVEELMARG